MLVAGQLLRRERRHKLQIYYDILSSIKDAEMNDGTAKPTRIMQLSNLAYDKLVRYLEELEGKKLIIRGNVLSITEQGKKFLQGYEFLKDVIEGMGLE